ncbi:MAG: hypothetical protein FJW69_04475 [Actinobacteria bacterium]|nr:hypothetical protein [Actinomycetota bacterium]MBM3713933.1 hypothetical protein [Actinomycetota bacterium]
MKQQYSRKYSGTDLPGLIIILKIKCQIFTIRRNDPCICGSGKNLKKCCS